MAGKTEFERAVERATGESIETLRDMPIADRRRMLEAKHRRKMSFPSVWPVIGRGNILRGYVVSHDEIEAVLDDILAKS